MKAIEAMNDSELIGEQASLAYLVEEVECFGSRDVLRLELVREELEKRGYKQTITKHYAKR